MLDSIFLKERKSWKIFFNNLNTDVNSINEWLMILYLVFPLVGYIASLVYLFKKEKIKAQATLFYAVIGTAANIVLDLIFGR